MGINDIVYIIGKYVPDPMEKPQIMEVKISHIEHRQFVAYRTDGETGKWCFSKKHLGKCVFLTRGAAEKILKESDTK